MIGRLSPHLVTGATRIAGAGVGGNAGGGAPLSLPYTYDISGQSAADLWSCDGFSSYGATDTNMTVGAANLADANGFTPDGVSKVAYLAATEATGGEWAIPDGLIGEGLPGLRFALLMKDTGLGSYLMDFADIERESGATAERFYCYWSPSHALDRHLFQTTHGSSDEIIFDVQEVDLNPNRWVWFRGEINYTAETGTQSVYRVEDASTLYSRSGALGSSAVSAGAVPAFNFFSIVRQATGSTVSFAKFWIGNLTDAWPES